MSCRCPYILALPTSLFPLPFRVIVLIFCEFSGIASLRAAGHSEVQWIWSRWEEAAMAGVVDGKGVTKGRKMRFLYRVRPFGIWTWWCLDQPEPWSCFDCSNASYSGPGCARGHLSSAAEEGGTCVLPGIDIMSVVSSFGSCEAGNSRKKKSNTKLNGIELGKYIFQWWGRCGSELVGVGCGKQSMCGPTRVAGGRLGVGSSLVEIPTSSWGSDREWLFYSDNRLQT